jgi:hypothetical protein
MGLVLYHRNQPTKFQVYIKKLNQYLQKKDPCDLLKFLKIAKNHKISSTQSCLYVIKLFLNHYHNNACVNKESARDYRLWLIIFKDIPGI